MTKIHVCLSVEGTKKYCIVAKGQSPINVTTLYDYPENWIDQNKNVTMIVVVSMDYSTTKSFFYLERTRIVAWLTTLMLKIYKLRLSGLSFNLGHTNMKYWLENYDAMGWKISRRLEFPLLDFTITCLCNRKGVDVLGLSLLMFLWIKVERYLSFLLLICTFKYQSQKEDQL